MSGAFAAIVPDPLESYPYTDSSVGVLTSKPIPDGTGIQLTLTQSFPDSYTGPYLVLRGKYEYKRSITESPFTVVYSADVNDDSEVTFSDLDCEDLTHYYYTVLAVCTENGTDHYKYNELTGFTTCYKLKDYGNSENIQNFVPSFWKDSETTTAFLSILGKFFDAQRSDIDAYLKSANSVDDVVEQHLPYLAHIINWRVNKELSESDQRNEVKDAPTVYKKKGKFESMEYLIQQVTGFDAEIEDGYDRVSRVGSMLLPTDSDTYARYHVNHVWQENTEVFTSDGSPDQVFTLTYHPAQKIRVKVDGTAWLGVDDLADYADDEVLLENESTGEITFGDDVNGAIPVAGREIEVTYIHSGDALTYLPAKYDRWINDFGTRLALFETEDSDSFSNTLVNKVQEIIKLTKPAHSVVNLVIVPNFTDTDEFGTFTDDYDDTDISSLELLISNTENSTSNTEGLVNY